MTVSCLFVVYEIAHFIVLPVEGVGFSGQMDSLVLRFPQPVFAAGNSLDFVDVVPGTMQSNSIKKYLFPSQ